MLIVMYVKVTFEVRRHNYVSVIRVGSLASDDGPLDEGGSCVDSRPASLASGVEGPMEAIWDVDRYLSPAQLLEGLSIQNQQKCSFILGRKIHFIAFHYITQHMRIHTQYIDVQMLILSFSATLSNYITLLV